MPYMKMVHDVDPREVIYKQIGAKTDKKTGAITIPGIHLKQNHVLVGVYMRPDKTKSGLYLSDQTRKEDEHQGKAALVLALGPSAFVSDEEREFLPEQISKVGDWVSLWVQDGRKINIRGQICRVIADQDIWVGTDEPDSIF